MKRESIQHRRVRSAVVIFCINMLCASGLAAQEPKGELGERAALRQQLESLQRAVEKLTKTVAQQQEKIAVLERGEPQAVRPIAISEEGSGAGTARAALPPAVASDRRGVGSYVPDIGIVADIVGTATQSDEAEDGNDRLSVREVEIVFGHDIDPYSRMDVVATFSDQEDPDIEEANVTYWGLPAGIKAKVGRMRQRIGKASANHRDALETVDEPFVVQRYFGHEGLFRTGAEFSAFAPYSTEHATQEIVFGIMQGGVGEGGELFGDVQRHPTGYGHLAHFFELSDTHSLEVGGTYLLGSQAEKSGADVQAFGLDLTYAHFVTPTSKLKIQSELYAQQRSERSILDAEGETLPTHASPLGMYALADYRLNQRWSLGTRFDYVEPTIDAEQVRTSERGYTGYVTFFQSEFARWRLQYQRALLLDGRDDNRFFLQGTFAIGAHKHNIN